MHLHILLISIVPCCYWRWFCCCCCCWYQYQFTFIHSLFYYLPSLHVSVWLNQGIVYSLHVLHWSVLCVLPAKHDKLHNALTQIFRCEWNLWFRVYLIIILFTSTTAVTAAAADVDLKVNKIVIFVYWIWMQWQRLIVCIGST